MSTFTENANHQNSDFIGIKLENLENSFLPIKNLKEITKKNKKFFYPLALSSWGEEEYKSIINQLQSGKLTMGDKVKEFELEFAKMTGCKHAIMVNSGSSANLLIIAALTLSENYDLNKGDEVIVPALGWSTSYSPLLQYGLKLRFVDININTLNIDENKITKAITNKTKAIFGINVLGNPMNFGILEKICNKHNLILIEDNCESMGAKYLTKATGTFGIAASHSFFFSHHIQTIEGGMITTDQDDISDYVRCLRAHGWTRDLSNESDFRKIKINKFKEKYMFALPGYNLRPNELNAVTGLCQLKKFQSFMTTRKQNSINFKNLFSDESFCIIQKSEHESSWLGFSIILNGPLTNKRSHLVYELEKAKIEYRPIITGNFLKNPVINYYDYSISENLNNTETVDNSGLYVGNYHCPLDSQISKLYEITKKLSKFY